MKTLKEKTLVIDGVDWLDPRMIWMDIIRREFKFKLMSINVDNIGIVYINSVYAFHVNDKLAQSIYKIAQGEMTAYTGGGQPVPDGVVVKVWDESSVLIYSGKAENAVWKDDNTIVEYQIQEQLHVEMLVRDKDNIAHAFKEFVEDVLEDVNCLPKCDSDAHEMLCPVANPSEAFKERISNAYIEGFYEGAGDDLWYKDHNSIDGGITTLNKDAEVYKPLSEYLLRVGKQTMTNTTEQQAIGTIYKLRDRFIAVLLNSKNTEEFNHCRGGYLGSNVGKSQAVTDIDDLLNELKKIKLQTE